MKLSQKQAQFAVNVASLINYIDKCGFAVTFGDAYRSPEAAEIYAKQGKGIKDSLHCKRLAVDLMLFDGDGNYITDSNLYAPFGKFWKSLNTLNRWGGDFTKLRDSNHYEMQDL